MIRPLSNDAPTVSAATRYGVLAWLCLSATIAYICRNSIGVAESTIRGELGLTEKTMGAVMGLFFLTYALGQIPGGWLGGRAGSRRCIPVLSIGWSIATAAISLASGAAVLIAARLVNGLFQAGLFPCCTNTIAKWFADNRRAVATGSLASFMSLGGAAGVALTGLLIDPESRWQWTYIGWRWTFVLYSLPGIFWAIGFYLWFRDTPEEFLAARQQPETLGGGEDTSGAALPEVKQEPPAAPAGTSDDEPTPWLAIYSSPATWWICGQQFCRGAGQIFFSSWFATYLQETRGVSVESSGLLNSLPLIALVAGSLIGGTFSDWLLTRTGSRRIARRGLASSSMFACAMLVFCAYLVQDPVLAVLIISAGTFCAAIGGPCAYTITIDMGGRHVPTLFATMNMIGNFGALLFIYGVPWFREQIGNWESVLLLFGFLYLGACLFWLLLRAEGDIFDQSLIREDRQGDPGA